MFWSLFQSVTYSWRFLFYLIWTLPPPQSHWSDHIWYVSLMALPPHN